MLKKPPPAIGEKFGNWTVAEEPFRKSVGRSPYPQIYCMCMCRCGTRKLLSANHLKSGATKSCGCNRQPTRRTHGKSRTTEYRIWCNMRNRCENTNNLAFFRYGGRGIRVCQRWTEPVTGFEHFLADMGPRPTPKHSVERKDNNGDYCPDNCVWATDVEQNRNRRSNVMLTHAGKTQCLQDWATELGVKRELLRERLKRGWSVEKTLTLQPLPSRWQILAKTESSDRTDAK